MVELIVDINSSSQHIDLEIPRGRLNIPHLVSITTKYFPSNKIASNINIKLTNLETLETLTGITNTSGNYLFDLLNLSQYGYLDGDQISVVKL